MIIWLTGQPGAGKTVLGDMLKDKMEQHKTFTYEVKRVDGDDLRDLTVNKDYSIKGRVANVDTAQKIAHYIHNNSDNVVVSLVSPYIDQREEFKELIGEDILEIYVHTTEKRERDHFHTIGYQQPISNFIDIDTTVDTPEESLLKIITHPEWKKRKLIS